METATAVETTAAVTATEASPEAIAAAKAVSTAEAVAPEAIAVMAKANPQPIGVPIISVGIAVVSIGVSVGGVRATGVVAGRRYSVVWAGVIGVSCLAVGVGRWSLVGVLPISITRVLIGVSGLTRAGVVQPGIRVSGWGGPLDRGRLGLCVVASWICRILRYAR
jgi:hypothetical protein